jgi:hypothetical protein
MSCLAWSRFRANGRVDLRHLGSAVADFPFEVPYIGFDAGPLVSSSVITGAFSVKSSFGSVSNRVELCGDRWTTLHPLLLVGGSLM